MSNSLAVCRLTFKRKTIIESLPKITACQIAVYLYSTEVFDPVVRDQVIQSLRPSRELFDQLIKLCRTKPEAYLQFLEALNKVDRKNLKDQIEKTEVFDTLKSHLNFLGQHLIVGPESRVEDFVDYILDKTLNLVVREELISKDREQFDPVNLGYNITHHDRDNSGSSTPSVGYSNRILELNLADHFGERKIWELKNIHDVSFLHGKFTLLEGPAGIGKSTLLGQLASLFVKGDLPKFNNVILLSCRKLNQFGDRNLTFENLIHSYGYTVDFDFTSQYFSDQLFIFDGFEEYNRRWTFLNDENKPVETRLSIESDERTSDEWIRYLICSSGKSVLIASRPGSLRFLKGYPYKLRLRVLGFNDRTIRDYFQMHNSADKLVWLVNNKGYLSLYSQLYKPLISKYYIKILNHSDFKQFDLPKASTEVYKRMFLLHIEEECYVHQDQVREFTGFSEKMTSKNLVPAYNAIALNDLKSGKVVTEDVSQACDFLRKVCAVCFQMVCSDWRTGECNNKQPSLRKSEVDEERAFEVAKRCGLFVHYDNSAFEEQDDVLLPHHLRAVEFGAALHIVRVFYTEIEYVWRNAFQSVVSLLSKNKIKAVFGNLNEHSFPHDVIKFAVGILAQSESNISQRQMQNLAKTHCKSLSRHLSDNTVLKLSVEVPDDTVWFKKLKCRTDEIVDGMFETLLPENGNGGTGTENSNDNDRLLLKIDNTDDKMQPSVLCAIIQILREKKMTSSDLYVPSKLHCFWIRHPWFIESLMDLPGVASNLTYIHFWGCKVQIMEPLKFLKQSQNLKHLLVQKCNLRKLSEEELEKVLTVLPENLETLDLTGNEVTLKTNHMEALKSLKCLKNLTLDGNALQPYEKVINLLPSQLEKLSLVRTDLAVSSEMNFGEKFPALKQLALSMNKIIPAAVLLNLPVSLEVLDLQRNHINLKETQVENFSFGYLKSLEVLILADTKMGNEILNSPSTFFPPSLRDLDISGADFQFDEIQTNLLFERIPKSIQRLDVSSNVLKFGKDLSNLSSLSNLQALDVSDVNSLFDKHINNLVNSLPYNSIKISLKLPKYCQRFEFDMQKREIELSYA